MEYFEELVKNLIYKINDYSEYVFNGNFINPYKATITEFTLDGNLHVKILIGTETKGLYTQEIIMGTESPDHRWMIFEQHHKTLMQFLIGCSLKYAQQTTL